MKEVEQKGGAFLCSFVCAGFISEQFSPPQGSKEGTDFSCTLTLRVELSRPDRMNSACGQLPSTVQCEEGLWRFYAR